MGGAARAASSVRARASSPLWPITARHPHFSRLLPSVTLYCQEYCYFFLFVAVSQQFSSGSSGKSLFVLCRAGSSLTT